jgi:hypothetical protein
VTDDDDDDVKRGDAFTPTGDDSFKSEFDEHGSPRLSLLLRFAIIPWDEGLLLLVIIFRFRTDDDGYVLSSEVLISVERVMMKCI